METNVNSHRKSSEVHIRSDKLCAKRYLLGVRYRGSGRGFQVNILSMLLIKRTKEIMGIFSNVTMTLYTSMVCLYL